MIPFPKLHIAESVLNRILNALDNEPSVGFSQIEMAEPPIPPNPTAEGLEVEEKLATPPAPASVPPEKLDIAKDMMIDESIKGGSPFDGALTGTLT